VPDNQLKNVLMLLVDGCEFSVFERLDEARALAPTITSFIVTGCLHKITSNGMITQVSLPAILTQTYPLDHGGYNFGIRYRPVSMIEVLKEHGYKTYFLAAHDITGPRRMYERGSDVVRSIYDNDDTVEDYIRLVLKYEIDLWKSGDISRADLDKILQTDFMEILQYSEWPGDRFDHAFTPRRLRQPTLKTSLRTRRERELLSQDPDAILHKLDVVPSLHYHHFLGEDVRSYTPAQLARRVNRLDKTVRFQNRVNAFFKRCTGLGISLFPYYLSPTAREIIDEGMAVLRPGKSPWFLFMQLMDHHDGAKTSRYFSFLKKLCYLPKLWKIRKRYPTHRDLWRDLSLIYLDREVSRMLTIMRSRGLMEDTQLFIFGDHGMGWDLGRGPAQMKDLGFRTHFEHIDVPLIVSDTHRRPNSDGVHDGMSISATILDEVGIKDDRLTCGHSIFEAGKPVVIVESTGRGSCDVERRPLYFTLTSERHRLMVLLDKDGLEPTRLFDRHQDPREYRNIIDQPGSTSVIRWMLSNLAHERGPLLTARGIDIKPLMDDSTNSRITTEPTERAQ
jgi:hypothetical protein